MSQNLCRILHFSLLMRNAIIANFVTKKAYFALEIY